MFMEPENAPVKRATDAIQVERVNGLRLRNVSVRWAGDPTEPKWASAAVFRSVRDVE
jgi:hypothetical protein